ncbi:hypothetical protein [Streptomyces sp900116325]|uniref:hypothetical protein n=1 Tax=Streptomyces sp. 900116325 TaxID=3154295 RepID=UPI0033B3C5DD
MSDYAAYPQRITRAQALAALDALGIPHTVTELRLDASTGADVTLYARNADGRAIAHGDRPVTVSLHIPFGEEATPDGTA